MYFMKAIVLIFLSAFSAHASNTFPEREIDHNFSIRLTPTKSPSFYIEAAHKYFNSIDSTAMDKTARRIQKSNSLGVEAMAFINRSQELDDET